MSVSWQDVSGIGGILLESPVDRDRSRLSAGRDGADVGPGPFGFRNNRLAEQPAMRLIKQPRQFVIPEK